MCDIIKDVGYHEFDKYRIYVEQFPSKWFRVKVNDTSKGRWCPLYIPKHMFKPSWQVSDIIDKVKLDMCQRSLRRDHNELKTFFE